MVDANQITNMGAGAASFFIDVLLYVVIGLFFAGILGFFLYMSKYDKKVVIRKKINGKNKIFYDKARKIDKDGVVWWKLFKAKKMIEVPPSKAIEVDRRGKDFVELYELETGEFIPLVDTNHDVGSIEPFTTNQRSLLQGQYTKAVLERGFKLTDHIGMLTYVSALVILIICLMVFYGDIASPVLEMGDKQANIAGQQIEMQKQINIMMEKLNQYQQGLLDASLPDEPTLPRGNISRGVPN